MVSDVVDTVRATVPAGGLVTPSSSMLTPSPAAIDWPLFSAQVRVVLVLEKQKPTFVAVVVSVTVEVMIVLSVVPAGKLIVIRLFAAFDSPPVAEVSNATL